MNRDKNVQTPCNKCISDRGGGASYPIDLVYLWVDGNDPEITKKRNLWKEKYGKTINKQGINKCRFIDNDELKYSLRSVEKYAPWINNIYIVTDNQIPKWLNTKHPKIHIVDHTEIMPEDTLPTFNALALETCIHKIKNLSEYFLYANDDMLFANPTKPEYFFTTNNLPIIRTREKFTNQIINSHIYFQSLKYSYELLYEKFGFLYSECPHHVIDSYKKSTIIECINQFEEYFNDTAHHKFRQNDDISRAIISAYAYMTTQGVLKSVQKEKLSILQKLIKKIKNDFHLDSICLSLHAKNINKIIKKYKPNLVCINDDDSVTDNERIKMQKFLTDYFPQKSQFEL